jgi:arsenite-transporting ATPase
VRILLYTGKGGVGKTSVAAATALLSARLGYRTAAVSTDAAHSLGDSFNVRVGYEPTAVVENLDAVEVDVNREIKANWGVVQEFLAAVLRRRGFDKLVAEEFSVFPGMEELFSLLRLKGLWDTGEYDVVVVDCAPTGATARLLSFPEIVDWYMDKFFNLERKIVKAVRPLAQRLTNLPLPSDDVFGAIEVLYQQVDAVKDMLLDGNVTSARLVLNPEKVVIEESHRAYTYLSLFGFHVDLVVANRVLPEEATSGYFGEWASVQARRMREVEESFSPLPILTVRHFGNEVVGLERLEKMGEEIFGSKDPTAVFFSEAPIGVTEAAGGYDLRVRLPGATREDLNVWVCDERLVISVHNQRRSIALPYALASLGLTSARMENAILVVEFRQEEGGEHTA